MRLGLYGKAGWVNVLPVIMLMALMPVMAAEGEGNPPLPPPRPDAPAPTPEPQEGQGKPVDLPSADAKPEDVGKTAETCVDRLKGLGVRFETRPAIQENACSVQDPVLVSALPDSISVSPASLMTCPTAESFVRWAKEIISVEANRHFQSAPTKILIGTSYQCRNQRSGSKLSEHAFGNGLDIMGFEFAKRGPLTIGTHAAGSSEETFQSAVRKGACSIFTTVLGPGSDAAHGDHLHVDTRARKGDYRICQ
jgi:hypothetical protein